MTSFFQTLFQRTLTPTPSTTPHLSADRVALRTETGQTWSYQHLHDRSAQIAHRFTECGVLPGQRVLMQAHKCVDAVMVYLACLRAGLIFVPLNTAYGAHEMAYFVQDAQPSIILYDDGTEAILKPLIETYPQGSVHGFHLSDRPHDGLLAGLTNALHLHHDIVPCHDQDVAVIIYTSGTTGRSKGAMLTHGNLAANTLMLDTYWGWTSDDVLIHALPIFHVHGLFVALHGALLAGACMIWMKHFDVEQVLDHLPTSTIMMGVPTMYTRLLADPRLTRERCQAMRLWISGSAPMLASTAQAWQDRTGHAILERYGMSETIMLTSNPYHPDPRYGYQSERRLGTVGFPLPDVTLRITQNDNILPRGEVGHIEVKGSSIFAGYWQMPEKTAQEFTSDGFFKTGDVGIWDADGYVHIVGREKDLYISGGYNVYPAEIEDRLNALTGVAESAVVGVPHPDWGEVGVAVVTPKAEQILEPETLLTQLSEHLAPFKRPKACFILQELPRNSMGKVQKNLLRQQYNALFMITTPTPTPTPILPNEHPTPHPTLPILTPHSP